MKYKCKCCGIEYKIEELVRKDKNDDKRDYHCPKCNYGILCDMEQPYEE